MSLIETVNNELKKEQQELKRSIARLFKIYLSKVGANESKANSVNDETKMLEEIESGFDKLITKKNESDQLYAIEQKDKEIRNLKEKLLSFAKTGQSGKGDSNNPIFKAMEKDKSSQNALYESIIVYIQNVNMKHLIELYRKDIQREEEIRTVLETKNKAPFEASVKKQVTELLANSSTLKKLCDQSFKEYEQRAMLYVPPNV